ncbi:MAG: hypothetical protein HRT50_12420 [Colwellia sp.]|uniref:hypothetical protein n=1 Tax=Colwellia sp. TaxID=56799 RepID=UPI001D6F0129|nr:hypothetical protein [Colwellia sp.]NQY49882.1 hypothetical protein [Colwellia sp.]
MKKTALAAFAILFTFIPQTFANFSYTPKDKSQVGLYLGGQIWQSEANGTFGEENSLINYKLKKEQQTNYFVTVKHPYSFLPNIRIESTSLNTTSKKSLTQGFSFGGESFPTGDDINTNFSVSYVDYTLYYGLLNNSTFSFDIGLTAKDLNGAVTVIGETIIDDDDCPQTSQGNPCTATPTTPPVAPTGKIKTDGIVPMLYIATDLSLPLKNLRLFAQGDFSLKDNYNISDYQLGLSYELLDTKMGDYDLTLGYKVVKMELENLNDLYTDLEFKGTFVGFIAHF